MSATRPKTSTSGDGGSPLPIDVVVWACLALAVAASVYFLLREPEDETLQAVQGAMAQARLLALAASVVGAVPGLWRILRSPRDRNLFAMAVLLNLMLACYWLLRFALT